MGNNDYMRMGFCNRCGLYLRLKRDGYKKHLLVCDTCWDKNVVEAVGDLVDPILIPNFQADPTADEY